MTSMTDGRGIVTQYVYNQLNELVETINAAQVPGVSANEPLPLTAFGYIDRYFYDANGNLVLSQVEDYGDTSNVGYAPPAGSLPSYITNTEPGGGVYYDDTVTQYDILDDPVGTIQEVGGGQFLDTRMRYDPDRQPGPDDPARGERHGDHLRRAQPGLPDLRRCHDPARVPAPLAGQHGADAAGPHRPDRLRRPRRRALPVRDLPVRRQRQHDRERRHRRQRPLVGQQRPDPRHRRPHPVHLRRLRPPDQRDRRRRQPDGLPVRPGRQRRPHAASSARRAGPARRPTARSPRSSRSRSSA